MNLRFEVVFRDAEIPWLVMSVSAEWNSIDIVITATCLLTTSTILCLFL